MGRHAKPHNPKEQQEPKEGSDHEHRPSRGRHAKDRPRCTSADEPAESLSTATK